MFTILTSMILAIIQPAKIYASDDKTAVVGYNIINTLDHSRNPNDNGNQTPDTSDTTLLNAYTTMLFVSSISIGSAFLKKKNIFVKKLEMNSSQVFPVLCLIPSYKQNQLNLPIEIT